MSRLTVGCFSESINPIMDRFYQPRERGMDSILRVLMPFFGPKNYSEMLWKIALADFWLTLACSFLVRYDRWINGLFMRVEHLPGFKEFAAAIKAPEVNVGGFALALLVLIFSRVTRFHDRISDIFKIRARFDRANILLPLAVMSGAQMSARQVANLKRDRHPLMMSKHRVFSFKPHLRPEWRGQDGQNETEQPDHSASLGDSVTASTRMRFSVHTSTSKCADLRTLWRTDVWDRIAEPAENSAYLCLETDVF
jgi:hypothetical protein